MEWLGHACFHLVSPDGIRVLTDPFDKGVPYPPISIECDAVTMSHEHSDHNSLAGVKGSPKALHGLDKDTKKVVALTERLGDVSFRTVPSFHDDQGGAKRGRNAIFVIDFAGVLVVHLGDLGHEPSDETVKEIGRCDVLLIPVGGFYTIDGPTADKVADALSPRVVVPMHYKTRYLASWPISGPEVFLRLRAEKGETVRNIGRDGVRLDAEALPAKSETWVFAI